jgi:3-oxoadipate enol-lactonase
MADTDSSGCRIFFEVSGPGNAPALLLCHALGGRGGMWASQIGAFSRRFRVIVPDLRGHGRSAVPAGDYTLDELGADVLAVLDAVGATRAHVCGLSIGGLIAMWLAINAPGRVGRLVPVCTSARVGDPGVWTERIQQVRATGLEAIADAAMTRWFTDGFRRQHPDTVARHHAMVTSSARDGYAGCCAVLRDTDLAPDLAGIGADTLMISGRFDPVAPPSAGQAIVDRIPRARLTVLEAAHMPNVERPEEFNAAVMEFLE